MHRIKTIIAWLACSLVIMNTACSTSPIDNTPLPTVLPASQTTPSPVILPSPTALHPQGTISIWHSWDETQIATLEEIIKDFQVNYPDILFDVLYIPSETLRIRYEEETLAGNGPTLLLAPAEWGPGLFDSGLVTDLTTLAKQDLLDTLNQAALGAARYQSALVGLPYTIEGVVLFRNKDIMTIQADTFDELVTLADAATQGEEIGAVLERSFLYSGAHLFGIGGKLSENGLPAFNDAFGSAWLELLRAFEQAGPTNYLSDEDLEAFKQDRVGWIIDGTWNLNALKEAIGSEKLAIDPWPAYGEGFLSGFVMADNLYLSANAQNEHRQVTWQFIQYFLSPEAQARLAEVDQIPAILMNVTDYSLIDQAIVALDGGTTYPIFPTLDIYQIHLDVALRSFLYESVPAANALQVADEAIRLDVAERNPTATPPP